MAITWKFESQEAIEFEDAIKYFDSRGDGLFSVDLFESARVLFKLRNNRRFVLNEVLSAMRRPEGSHSLYYVPTTMILHKSEYYFIRIIIWPDANQKVDGPAYRAHDHNFSFFTCGYLGPGYRTLIYEYDRSTVTGCLGELIKMEFLEESVLGTDKVMLYRNGRDIHIQFPPENLSVSLNVVETGPASLVAREGIPPQFIFDLSSSTIAERMTRYSAETLLDFMEVRGRNGNLLQRMSENKRSSGFVRQRALELLGS